MVCHREGCFGPGKMSQNACLGAGTRSPAAAMPGRKMGEILSISAAQQQALDLLGHG